MADPGVTNLLRRLSAGDRSAQDELIPLIYGELKRIAGASMRGERPGHSLQATALVHEVYIRLAGNKNADWKDRSHFFAVAAHVMRQVLVDYARARRAGKRGGGQIPVSLDSCVVVSPENCETILEIHDLLEKLRQFDERQARIVELRFFVGLTEEEIALLMGMSSRTIKRDWIHAKAWLAAALAGG
ncbi:MAG: sigma-70 family RNA polymerase sigma factor [Bryobacteraceae bacterium]